VAIKSEIKSVVFVVWDLRLGMGSGGGGVGFVNGGAWDFRNMLAKQPNLM
jgi:hypothetical protein